MLSTSVSLSSVDVDKLSIILLLTSESLDADPQGLVVDGINTEDELVNPTMALESFTGG